jgi:hypothetical protein
MLAGPLFIMRRPDFMPYNFQSPKTLLEAIDPANIERWYVRETVQVESEAVRHVLHHFAGHLADFVQGPPGDSFNIFKGDASTVRRMLSENLVHLLTHMLAA